MLKITTLKARKTAEEAIHTAGEDWRHRKEGDPSNPEKKSESLYTDIYTVIMSNLLRALKMH